MTAKSPTPAGLTWSGVTARRMTRHAVMDATPTLTVGPVTVGAHA